MSESLEVILIEDHLAVRKGLELLLGGEGMRIAGTAAGVQEAQALLARRRFDVVLLDLRLADGDGIELLRGELERRPETAFVIHTGVGDAGELGIAARAGARGFVLKSAPPAELVRALRQVAAGGTYIDTALAGQLMPPGHAGRLSALTAREREILELLACGLSGEEVSERLIISSETVRTHIRNAMTKLGARTRVQAVALTVADRGGWGREPLA